MDSPRTMLRVLVAIAATIAATGFVFSFFPGLEVYRITSGRSETLYVDTLPVVEHWNWLLGVLVILLAPGAVIWRKPRISYALLWSLWAIAVATLVFVATFQLGDWGVRTVALWPHAVFGFLMSGLLFLVIAIVPIACGAYWWMTRERPVRPMLPVARLVKSRA
ncbi:MAG: hypothetical protein M4D80_25090 [Myxococcota bacterium]|nr:hypothetical protein [Deltaproteobacteria bacterium]MDQ3338456.1 hypothetical protein [Myxococcota bacterium]